MLQEMHFRFKDINRLKIKRQNTLNNHKLDGGAIQTSDKIDLKTVTKEKYTIIIRESIQQVDITIINIYSPNKYPKVHEGKTDRIKGRNQ